MKFSIFILFVFLALLLSVWTIQKYHQKNDKRALRASYHLSVESGWSNDLQTIIWNEEKQVYDLYFLHSKDGATNPFGPSGQDWYHTTTKDFYTFSKQNTAIVSQGGDEERGWKTAWTGSIIQSDGRIAGTKNGQLVAYLSGQRKDNGQQAVWAIASEDNGETFTKILNNGDFLLDASQAENQTDFRDPYVFRLKNDFYMYVAEGDYIGVYRSDDGLTWQLADGNGMSKIFPETFFNGRNWTGNAPVECPVIKTMVLPDGRQKQVLFFGAKDASKGETTGTYYTVGRVDEHGLFHAEKETLRLDAGSDFYGANFSGTADLSQSNTELIALAWIGNWNYTAKGVHVDEAAEKELLDTLGSYSLARNIRLDADLTLRQEIQAPQGNKIVDWQLIGYNLKDHQPHKDLTPNPTPTPQPTPVPQPETPKQGDKVGKGVPVQRASVLPNTATTSSSTALMTGLVTLITAGFVAMTYRGKHER
nr:hypothetical protein [Streptococcus sp. DD10]